MDKNLIIRVGVLVLSLLNMILTMTGSNPIAVSDSEIFQIVSILAAVLAAVWNSYKNNNFSSASRLSQMVLDAIKDGRISADKVEKFLEENNI